MVHRADALAQIVQIDGLVHKKSPLAAEFILNSTPDAA
jgi:hypothetical protein